MERTFWASKALNEAVQSVQELRLELLTPEAFLLFGLCEQDFFIEALADSGADAEDFRHELEIYVKDAERIPEDQPYNLEASAQMIDILQASNEQAIHSSAEAVDVPHFVQAIMQLPDSWAAYLIRKHIACDEAEFLNNLIDCYDCVDGEMDADEDGENRKEPWRNFVVCINDLLKDHNPLIGRNAELERTIQVLCRKEKIIRCMWVNLGWVKPLSFTVLPNVSKRAMCRLVWKASISTASIWVDCWPVRSSVATSKSESSQLWTAS